MNRRRLAVSGLVAAALLVAVFWGVDWRELADAFRRAHPGWLLGVGAASVLTYVLRAWRWGYLLAPLARVRFRHLLSATYIGFMAGLFIPRAGEVLRPYLVGRRHAFDTSAAFASIILERLLDLATVLLLFGLSLYVLAPPATLGEGALKSTLVQGGGLAGLAALAVLVSLVALHAWADGTLALIERLLRPIPERWRKPLLGAIRSFAQGLGVLRASVSHLGVIAAQSALVWLVIAAGIHAANRAFDIVLPFQSTFLMMGFLTVGVAVPTPGNVGGFHGAYVAALVSAYRVDQEAAAAAAVACHALTNLPVLLVGLGLLPGEGLTLGQVAEMSEKGKEDAP